MNFNNFNMFGFNAAPAFTFSMPSLLPQIPPIFSFQPQRTSFLGGFNFGFPQNFDNPFAHQTQTVGAKFDSFKLTDFSLDGFEPISYVPKPLEFTLPSFDFTSTSTTTSNSKTGTKINPNPTTSIADVAQIYNKNKGINLAQEVLKDVKPRSTGYCATYVKSAIQDAGLGSYVSGHAYQLPSILKNNKNFKEVHVAAGDLNKLPAGCVIAYDKGAANYSKTYGHCEITLGNGKAASDFITNNLRAGDARVFVPV